MKNWLGKIHYSVILTNSVYLQSDTTAKDLYYVLGNFFSTHIISFYFMIY